jgi:hypothetical protein
MLLWARPGSLVLIVEQNPVRRPVEIVKLARPESP